MRFIKKIETLGGDKPVGRLPASDEEKAAAIMISDEVKEQTGISPRSEQFTLRPHGTIGSIPHMGIIGLIALATYYIPLVGGYIALSIIGAALIFAACHIFRYLTIFDFLLKKGTSQNIIAEAPATAKENTFTIIYSAHYDTSWNWNHSNGKRPQLLVIKLILGVVSIFGLLGLAIARVATGVNIYDGLNPLSMTFLIAPLIALYGLYILATMLSYDKKKASPGAMDNLSGTGIALELFKHFADKKPENCNLVFAALGSEEAGLKGAWAFVKKYKNTEMLKNAYAINIDSIADIDHFEVIKGDLWQTTFFDKNLIAIAQASLEEANLKPHPKGIYNPVGGCDSTPFCKKGIPTVTVAAQNPVPTNYYHTYNDLSTRFNEDVLSGGFHALTILTEKIFALNNPISKEENQR
jgi:hypothetical protein